MSSTPTDTELLKQRFNLLPGIDKQLINTILVNPRLAELFSLNMDAYPYPNKIVTFYEEFVSILLKDEYPNDEIMKIISEYVKGRTWENWNDEERAQFVSDNVKNQDEKQNPAEIKESPEFPIKVEDYTINKNGVYKEKTYYDPHTGRECTYPYLISPTPCYITSIGANIDDNKIQYKLYLKNIMGYESLLWKNPGDLLRRNEVLKLQDEGMHFQEQEAKELVNYFGKYILKYKDKLPIEITASSNGWKKDYSLFVIGDKAISKDGVQEVIQQSEDLHKKYDAKGTKEEWVTNLKEFIDYDLTRLKMYATVGAFLIRFTPIETFLIHNYFESSGSKSLTMRIAASLIGNPNKDGLIQSADISKTGLELYLQTYSDTPIYLDDTSANEGFIKNVYMIGNEKGKGRGTKDLTYRGAGDWRTICQSTGEEPLTKGVSVKTGNQTRVIEVHERIKKYPQTYIDNLNMVLAKNYGLFTEEIMEEIFKIRENIDMYFDSASKMIGEPVNEFEGRKKGYFVVLGIAGWIVETVLSKNGIPGKNPYKLCRKYYEKCVLEDPTIPYAERALQNIYQWTVRNPSRFERSKCDFGSDGLAKGAYETYGWITKDSIYYDEGLLSSKLEELGFNYERVKEDWKKDIIEPYAVTDKKTNESKIKSYASPTTINGKRIRGIRIKIKTLADKLNMEEPIFEMPAEEIEKEPDEMNLTEKCIKFLNENSKYKTVAFTDEQAAIGLIREHDQIELIYGKEYIVQTMSLCRSKSRGIQQN